MNHFIVFGVRCDRGLSVPLHGLVETDAAHDQSDRIGFQRRRECHSSIETLAQRR